MRNTAIIVAFLALGLALAWAMPLFPWASGIAGYLPLHTLLETISIIIAVMVFAVGWNADTGKSPGMIILLACAFLGVALLDFSHALSYDGMPNFVTPSGPEKAIDFWLAARSMAAVALLAAAVMRWRPFASAATRYVLLAATLSLTAFITWLFLFHEQMLPHTFLAGKGLTSFKVACEYGIIAANLATLFVLWLRMTKPQPYNVAALFGAVSVMALSELFFTMYAEVTDIYNLLGHIYKVISYLFIYRAIFVTTIEDPYRMLGLSQTRLQATLDALPDLMFEVGLDGRFHSYHSPYADLKTSGRREYVGRLLQETFPPDVSQRVLSALQQAGETGRSSGEYDLESASGKRWFEFSVVRKPVGAGQSPSFIVLSRDVSQRKRAELALEQSESLFRTLAQVAPVGVFHIDPAGNCTYVNERYCEIAGISMEAALGDGWFDTIHPADIVRFLQRWESSRRGLAPFSLEYRIPASTGLIIWVYGQARAEIGVHGEVLGYVGTITDITERKRFEERLTHLNEVLEQRVEQRTAMLLGAKEEAEQASRVKSLFLANMSHELRTPLNAILGYAQLMQIEPGLPRHIVENAHEIKRAGDFLLTLMNDMLDLAQIESGRMEMQITTFDLAEVINECHAQNNALAAVRNIVLACDENCGALRVRADRRRLVQVLNNLVSNAIKYNSDGGKVGISCNETVGGRIRISVADSGMGIAPEKQAQLFEPFNRLGAEMGTIEGTGIGLIIARRLLESMDGRIGVESTPGTGSMFWVELPADETSVASIARGTMQERAQEKEKFRVLVAEDYAANQAVLRLQLQTLGYETDVVCNGAEAFDKWRASHYHLILTDLDMPVMDGLALARAVRAEERVRGSHIAIIGVTAATVREEMSLCRAAAIDDVLAKPISLGSLKDMLSRWLANATPAATAAPMMQASPEGAILDAGQLYRILGKTDPKLLQELLATFLISARKGLDALDTRLEDAEAVSREMHKLKSSAKTVGAMRFAQLAEALEKQSKQDSTAGFGSYLTGLREALDQIEAEMPGLRMDPSANGTGPHPVAETPVATCRSVLVVDDDVVVLQHMKRLLATLGVQQVLTAMNGLEAVKLVSTHGGELEVLICDLNMPEMDGVELIRNFGQTGFKGGLILMSGADENVLSTVSRLAGLQGLRVLGQAHKPVMPDQIAKLLARPVEESANIRKMASVHQQVSREEIRAGMAGNEFSVWFQPKVEAVSLKPAGFEALARWQRPGGKFIATDTFITAAEQNGIIGELSKLLVVIALKEGSKLFAAGFPFKIAINLSGRWLDDLNLPEFIHENTIRAGLRADDVILEVTETGVMEDLTTALDVLTRLRLKGFGLSIDDFGIGYSSFEQLGRIPFTELKLDRSFVNKGTTDPAARAILEGSMDMARKLKLSSVAEGVETQAELELIRSLGCERVQGYLIAKPMHPDDLLAWLRSR
ncbi:MAG: MASE3 domain-containing protein [Gallionella sp.]